MYIPCKIDMSDDQMQHLCSGQGVHITPSMLGRGHHMFITGAHARKLKEMHSTGTVLKMSHANLMHNVKHGGSVFEDFLSVLNTISKNPAVQEIAKAAVKHYGPKVLEKVKAKASRYGFGTKTAEGGSMFGVAGDLLGFGKKRKTKAEPKKKVVRKKRVIKALDEASTIEGGNFLDDILGGVGSTVNSFLQPITSVVRQNPELAQLGMRALMSGAGGKRKRSGTGPQAVGAGHGVRRRARAGCGSMAVGGTAAPGRSQRVGDTIAHYEY